ncbi:hypothetical protein K7X08_023462 [Anisodus acutangulus]|uniref:Smr domain-containing protein n=1 Tax=Anisodus acutangulus TaxID=402998 RepID=A0A9Q1R2Q4_9SOLA|nr:hypothetical protein K7X08_023462 [Anisodus acutangulus]
MLRNGVQPDRITFNSLLAVCSGAGLWETARGLFNEMVYRGIDQDIYTYNTFLDAACNGGQVDVAFDIMSEMHAKNILPNQVTYSTVIRGCAKAGRLDTTLSLFNEMKCAGITLDRVSYNTLLAIYASLGKFEEALNVSKEMESMGIKKDIVTYNALLDGFGKQGMFTKVKQLFAEMKAEKLSPNLLTYSTLISVYLKGGLYEDAVEVYKEFKKQGLKADVVFYSKLIDALCKKGLVEYSWLLLNEMTKEGIQPNVVTYNSIINAFGESATNECGSDNIVTTISQSKSEEDNIIKIFEQLAAQKSASGKKTNALRQDLLCISGVFHKMHELQIKPNVVTFSAILNACIRCSSFDEASLLLEELRLFDNQVYGVAHGLLMGQREGVWAQTLSLFNEVKQMDSSTASAFYNALTDMLWHFGQKEGAQLVVLEGKRSEVWEHTWSTSCLDLHLMSSGAACAMVHAWLLSIRSIVFGGHELPKMLSILTGWGKHNKVTGDGALKRAIEGLLTSIGAPFQVAKCNIGRFISTGAVVAAWLRESGTLEVLVLQDDTSHFGKATSFNVDANFSYLVRFHWCDFIVDSTKINSLVFNVYINGQIAERKVDLVALQNGKKAAPLVKDYVTYVDDKEGDDHLWIAVHPSGDNSELDNAIVNELEIFKINGENTSLAGQNPTISDLMKKYQDEQSKEEKAQPKFSNQDKSHSTTVIITGLSWSSLH